MPGKPSSTRSRSTGGVITPRFSATSGSGPSSRSAASKSARARPARASGRAGAVRCPGRHRPVGDEAAEVVEPGERRRARTSGGGARPTSGSPAPASRSSRRAGCPRAGRVALSASGGAPATTPRRKSSGCARVVGAVAGDVDRDVAEEPHPALGGVAAERAPLAVEAHLVGDRRRRRRTRPSRRSSSARARRRPRAPSVVTRASGRARYPACARTRTSGAYGEPAQSGGPSGSSAHHDWPAAASQSTNGTPRAPSRPPGSEDTCSRTPLDLRICIPCEVDAQFRH